MTFRATNNDRNGPPVFDITVADDVDEYPFIAITIEDADMAPVLDMIIDDESYADEFLDDVRKAVEGYKRRLKEAGTATATR